MDESHLTFIQFNKCIVLHYGNNNPNFVYTLCDHVFSPADSANDLGVIRATNLPHDDHYTNIIRRANSVSASILRNFAYTYVNIYIYIYMYI